MHGPSRHTRRNLTRNSRSLRGKITYWVFDRRLVRFHYFSGTGEIVEDELMEDPSIVKLCAQAFETVWERAIPHDLYRPI